MDKNQRSYINYIQKKEKRSNANKAHFDDEEILTIYVDQITRCAALCQRIELRLYRRFLTVGFKHLNLKTKRWKNEDKRPGNA